MLTLTLSAFLMLGWMMLFHTTAPLLLNHFYRVLNLVGKSLYQKIVLSGLHVHAGLQKLNIWKLGIGVFMKFLALYVSTAVWYWILSVRGIKFSFSNNDFVQLNLLAFVNIRAALLRSLNTYFIWVPHAVRQTTLA